MKKFTFLILLAVFSAGAVSAQYYNNDDDPERFRKKYRNISFASQKLVYDLSDWGVNADVDLFKSKVGAAFTAGRSYILHKNPLLGMIRIGLDATWFDINYALYKPELEGMKFSMHQADISMGIGPSVHVNPISKLGVHAYFRYNPTFATLFTTEGGFAMDGGYSSVFVTGGAVSWGVISVGVEARWGKAKYSNLFGGGDDEEDGGDFPGFEGGKYKLKTKGMRVYIGFRF